MVLDREVKNEVSRKQVAPKKTRTSQRVKSHFHTHQSLGWRFRVEGPELETQGRNLKENNSELEGFPKKFNF